MDKVPVGKQHFERNRQFQRRQKRNQIIKASSFGEHCHFKTLQLVINKHFFHLTRLPEFRKRFQEVAQQLLRAQGAHTICLCNIITVCNFIGNVWDLPKFHILATYWQMYVLINSK